MKQKIERMPVISWLKKRHIPDYADIVLYNVIDKELTNKELKNKINNILSLDEDPLIVRIPTEPFLDAMFKAKDKLSEEKIWTSLDDGVYTGVLILNNVVYYRFEKQPGAKDYDLAIFTFDKYMTWMSSHIQVSGMKHTNTFNPLYISGLKANFSHYAGFSDKDIASDVSNQLYITCILFELFRKHADVEIKVMPPKFKGKLFNCQYQNLNDQSIEIMDSTWFTQLVISEAFNVRGHFRLQPYGPGLKERKLVWIEEFKKKGYTRQAKMETA